LTSKKVHQQGAYPTIRRPHSRPARGRPRG